MKTLPNGLTIFNATPHDITFQCPTCGGTGECGPNCTIDEGRCFCDGWGCRACDSTFDDYGIGTIVVLPDRIINAHISEREVGKCSNPAITYVTTEFLPTTEGEAIIDDARASGADMIVGSIIAAQAYPGQVVAMIPAAGYERKPPAEKRMLADKFTIF